MKLVLEQRYLFDGAAAATAQHAFGDGHHHHNPASPWAGIDTNDAAHTALPTPPAISEPHVGSTSSPETVLFVDPRVADWQELVAGVKRGVDVIMLDPNQDGISQVTQALASLTNVKNVEFLTDGTPGSITLGGTTLDAAVLGANTSAIAGWSAHLATNANIVFWGCDVGQGSAGATFVSDVHTLTGATVGASSDATGAAALGGNWSLEVATGPLHRDVNPFTKTALAGYNDVLDTPQPNVALQVTDNGVTEGGTLGLGDTITASVNFQNTAENATGYTPYVELFVPTTLTETGHATENGVALTELTATVTNGVVINPLTGQTEAAPIGFTNGTLHVYELPVDSIGPSAPIATVIAGFTVTSDPSLAGQSLQISARGGFANGAVAGSGTVIEGDTYSSMATLAVPLDPSVAVIAASNQTDFATTYFDPTGTSSGAAVTVTPGEIVRLRATDQLPSGSNSNVQLTIALPTGLTYSNDSTATILLVSADGSVTTSTSLTGSGGLQLTDVSPNTAKLDLGTGADTADPVTAILSSSAISYNSTTNTLVVDLGTLGDSGIITAAVEFNAVVGNTVSNGASLTSNLSVPGSSTTGALQTVQTGYTTTDFTNTVLSLPLFDSSLGALTSVTLTVAGQTVTSGTIKNTSSTGTATGSDSLSSKITLSQAVGGPVLPNGTVVVTRSEPGVLTQPRQQHRQPCHGICQQERDNRPQRI
jgi:hypothetical protein